MKRAANALELIGATPVVRLNRVAAGLQTEVWGKLESANPGGSVKDRIALAMVAAAEASGQLQPGGTIVEPSSGNTGIGLAMVAAVKGYRLMVTMFDTASRERRAQMEAYGAEVILTPAAEGMRGAMARAQELVRDNPGYFMPQQFTNPANPEVHARTTGRELVEQLGDRLRVFVAGVGTGGSISGVGRALKEAIPGVRVVAVEPHESQVLTGGAPGVSYIEGLGAGFVPATYDAAVVDEVVAVRDDHAYEMARRLAREEGLLVGISAGANVCAALREARAADDGAVVGTILCDTGLRYLSTRAYD